MRQAAERLLRKLGIIRGAVVAARVGSVIGGVLIPSAVAPGTPTPGQIREMERAATRAQRDVLQEVPVNVARLPEAAVVPGPRVGPPAPRVTGPAPSTTSAGTRTGIPPVSGASTGPFGSLRRLPWAQILLSALTGSGNRPRVSVSPVVNVAPSSTPLTLPQPQALPSSQLPPIVLTGSPSETCECPPKRKRRDYKKCLEWAPVKWAGGRYRGKNAGRKCVRRET